MAKKSAVEKNNRRRKMVDRFAARREALKAVVMNREGDPGERFEATIKLAELPRNSSKIRVRNRCSLTRRALTTRRRSVISVYSQSRPYWRPSMIMGTKSRR